MVISPLTVSASTLTLPSPNTNSLPLDFPGKSAENLPLTVSCSALKPDIFLGIVISASPLTVPKSISEISPPNSVFILPDTLLPSNSLHFPLKLLSPDTFSKLTESQFAFKTVISPLTDLSANSPPENPLMFIDLDVVSKVDSEEFSSFAVISVPIPLILKSVNCLFCVRTRSNSSCHLPMKKV